MKFKYSQYPAPNGKSIYRASVPILFKHGSSIFYTEGIIDSGADYTILPIEVAGELNIKLESKKKATFLGAGSNPFTVYESPVKIQHLLRQNGFRSIQWESIVYFAESQPGVLLGNFGFLDRLKVTLDGTKKEVEIIYS